MLKLNETLSSYQKVDFNELTSENNNEMWKLYRYVLKEGKRTFNKFRGSFSFLANLIKFAY